MTNKPLIIGLTGPAGAGKTECAKILANLYSKDNLKAKIVPLATPLKDTAKKIGWNGKKDEKGRKLLQLLGTEIGRNLINKDIWVNMHEKTIDNTDADIVLVDDVRFANEASYIIFREGGVIIEVTGRGYYLPKTWIGKIIRKVLHFTRIKRIHASELPINRDFLSPNTSVLNTGTLMELEREAKRIKKQLGDTNGK